jgi:hypothetical protein
MASAMLRNVCLMVSNLVCVRTVVKRCALITTCLRTEVDRTVKAWLHTLKDEEREGKGYARQNEIDHSSIAFLIIA